MSTASLTIIDERGRKLRVRIRKAKFAIGKKPGNDLVLNRANISREHCVILNRDGRFYIRDLDSQNGTNLEGRRLAEETPLADGSRIGLGNFTLVFHVEGEKSPPEPEAGQRRQTPVELKEKMHSIIIKRLDLKHSDLEEKSPEEIRKKTMEAAEAALKMVAAELPRWLPGKELIKEVVDEAVGYGPLEELLADDSINEIMVNNWDRIYVERNGKIEKTNKRFTSNDQVLGVIRRILAPIGRRIDESSPMVDARLPDGSRVNAIINPLVLTGPTLTIRKFAAEPFTIDNLISFGTLSREMAEFLKLCVRFRQDMCISGGTGSGKTTLLNVISGFIPHTERIITIEDTAELKLPQEHVVSLESKPSSIEGRGGIPIRDLVINSLRMRPDRIIVGECRGGEALDMLQAMNTGHDGSLTTIHANSVRDTLSRIETMVLMAGMDLPTRAIREQIASAIDIIIQTSRLPDGTRKITCVAEITGMEGDNIVMQSIFEFEQSGFDGDGAVLGSMKATGAVPLFVHDLRKQNILVDLALFSETD